MKLQMKDLDIDTYIATFERLTAAARWEADAKGTIARFQVGLADNVHCRILYCNTIPTTMAEWKTMARREVNRIHEICSSGLPTFGQRPRNTNMGQFQSTCQSPPTRNNNNNNVVPMDVDATLTSTIPGTPFQKLTDDE